MTRCERFQFFKKIGLFEKFERLWKLYIYQQISMVQIEAKVSILEKKLPHIFAIKKKIYCHGPWQIAVVDVPELFA